MSCSYLAKGESRRCLAFRGLMLPSSGEFKEFCTGDFEKCPIFQLCEKTGEKVTRNNYVMMQDRVEAAS